MGLVDPSGLAILAPSCLSVSIGCLELLWNLSRCIRTPPEAIPSSMSSGTCGQCGEF